MQPSSDEFDQFFREQLHQLRAKGHSATEAADIFFQAQKAILEACQKLLEQCQDGELPAEDDGGQVQL